MLGLIRRLGSQKSTSEFLHGSAHEQTRPSMLSDNNFRFPFTALRRRPYAEVLTLWFFVVSVKNMLGQIGQGLTKYFLNSMRITHDTVNRQIQTTGW